MLINEDDYLAHYGMPRRSGRYPWGSGGNVSESTRNANLLDEIARLQKEGLTKTEIAKGFGMSTTTFRDYESRAIAQQKAERVSRAQRLKNKGMGATEIGRQMGISESTVRGLLTQQAALKANSLDNTVDALKLAGKESPFIDVGKGVENHMGVSREKLRAAVRVMVEEEGYTVMRPKTVQLGTKELTERKILVAPGNTFKDLVSNIEQAAIPGYYSDDQGQNFTSPKPPKSVGLNRVAVRYAEDGGTDADGVIYVRPGTNDISLGNSNYAQVRIKVGPNHYLKGMAIYKDDLPEGVDLMFNTNKSDTGKKTDAFKELGSDPLNPFGAVTRQIPMDPNNPGGARSAANLVNEAGTWDTWSRNLSTQMLSKQSPALARTQLDIDFEDRKADLDQIMQLTNPEVKKRLLQDFADSADSAAVHMKAASLPRQATKVLLPINTLKDNEAFAPGFDNGESVALIRYPHGGTFEIPILRVNNKNAEATGLIGKNATDAIGINARVAERLSGADFDGDTVLVIPNNDGRVKNSPALDGLRNFNPREQYKLPAGVKPITEKYMQQEMGNVSNLITDMTLRKASSEELARAVRHSMVVIDSYKHKLDYRQSRVDNNIAQLKKKYQTDVGPDDSSGATTLISRAQRETRVNERQLRRVSEGGPIDPVTGRRVFVETGRTFPGAQGTTRRTSSVKELDLVDDANILSSGTRMEGIYASHSNRTKDLANQARLAILDTPRADYDRTAAKVYSTEVASINAKLDAAERNAPIERRAQSIANATVRMRKVDDPSLKDRKDELKKVEALALTDARNKTGASRTDIRFTDQEWAAVQAGAISSTKLEQVLRKADMDRVRELATPREAKLMNSARIRSAESRLAMGYTREEVARSLGVSVSTLDKSLEQ